MGRSIFKKWLPWLVPVPLYFGPFASIFLPIFLGLRARLEPQAFYRFIPFWLSAVGLVGTPVDMAFFGLFVVEGYLLATLKPSTYVSLNCVVSVAVILGLYYCSPYLSAFEVYGKFQTEMDSLLLSFLDKGAFKRLDWLDSKSQGEQLIALKEMLLLFFLGFQTVLGAVQVYIFGAFTRSKDRFRDFRPIDGCIWLFIFFFGLFLLPVEACALPARAGLAALVPLYFLQGLAIVLSYLRAHGIGGVWRILVLALLLYALHFFVFLVGLFDLWFDFRKRLEVQD